MILEYVFIVLLIVLIVIIFLLINEIKKSKSLSLEGVYTYNESTEYMFNENNIGCMCVIIDGEEYHFDYKYRTEKNRLYIDFDNENITDICYEYSLSHDSLILVGREGSAGGTYELTKINENHY